MTETVNGVFRLAQGTQTEVAKYFYMNQSKVSQ